VTRLPFSPARQIGELVALSGQVGIADGKVVAGGFLAELEQALLNLDAVLLEAGLTRRDVIKTNVYLTQISDWALLNEPYAKFFSEPYPARTALAVTALPLGAHVEIEAWAVRS
jgi:2-iminobutanoate/2-iminopropanoate deaminase